MSATGAEPYDIQNVIGGTPYHSYTYSYPHKTAYRQFDAPVPLQQLWADEDQNSLFLYLHVPFCEHRCGFCNLFTQANPEDGFTSRYLRQLRNEASRVREALRHDAAFSRLAIGGGTPTFLSVKELAELLEIACMMGADAASIPVSVEVSPATVDRQKLQLLRDFGADRISIGIQSFDEAEAGRLGRPQKREDVLRALSLIREVGFPILNIDLIYGGEGQSAAQWISCVEEAMSFIPEELYLYPLYVRPLTGLGRLQHNWDDQRLSAYRTARDHLRSHGYKQTSMRMFERAESLVQPGPVYCCQSDGMIGLGCGARSYTTTLHYSTEFAVGRRGVRSILADYVKRDADSFSFANHGYQLPEDDQRRRHAIMSLLQVDGLNRADYVRRFHRDVLQDLPKLQELSEHGLAVLTQQRITLSDLGMERSDAIGPWLYSDRVRELMFEYELV